MVPLGVMIGMSGESWHHKSTCPFVSPCECAIICDCS